MLRSISKLLSNLVTVLLFVVFLVLLFFVIASKASGGEPEFFGYQLKTVLSGSMEPGIQTGSIIAVKPGGDMTRFTEGDVITYMAEEDRLITHRITEVVHSGENVMYRTKGDNNNAEDRELVLSDNVVAEYVGVTVPYVGYFIDFARSQAGSALLLILPGILLVGYAGFTIWQVVSSLDKKMKASADEEAINPKS